MKIYSTKNNNFVFEDFIRINESNKFFIRSIYLFEAFE